MNRVSTRVLSAGGLGAKPIFALAFAVSLIAGLVVTGQATPNASPSKPATVPTPTPRLSSEVSPKPAAGSGGSPCSSGVSASIAVHVSAQAQVSATGQCVLSVFNGTTWSSPTNPFANDGVYGDFVKSGASNCSNSSECVVLSNDGYLAVYNGASWTAAADPFSLDRPSARDYATSLVCPTATFCLAYSRDGWVSALSGTSWLAATNPFASDGFSGDYIDVGLNQSGSGSSSCLSTTFCYAVSIAGYSSIFNGSTWSVPISVPGANTLSPVQSFCATTAFCMMEFNDGSLSFDTGEGWSGLEPSPFPPSDDLQGSFTCLPGLFCYEVGVDGGVADFNGGEVTSQADPFIGLGTYTSQATCLSATFCVAASRGVYVNGHYGGYTSYFDGSVWHTPYFGGGALPQCTSSTLCVVSTDVQTYDGTNWNSTGNPFATDGTGSDTTSQAFCVTAAFCYATSQQGFFAYFNGTSWSSAIDPFASDGSSADAIQAANCLSATLCYANSYGGFLATFTGASWAPSTNPFASDGSGSDTTSRFTCLSSSFCFASSNHGYVAELNGTSWTGPVNPIVLGKVTGQLSSESCASNQACLSIGGMRSWPEPFGATLSSLEAHDPSTGGCGCTGAQATAGEPVNTATGDFETSTSDLSVPGAGVPLGVTSSYSSLVAQNEIAKGLSPGVLGYGWSNNLGMSVAVDPGTNVATVTEENGSEITFVPYVLGSAAWWCSAATNYCPTAPRSIATLNLNADGTWTFVRSVSGTTTFTFDASGQLVSETDSEGESLAASAGTPGVAQCPAAAASCTVWTSSMSGRSITLAYNSNTLLQSATDQAGNATTYCDFGQSCAPSSGGQSGDLASITQFAGTSAAETTKFTYDTSNGSSVLQHDMLTDVLPGGGTNAQTANTYGAEGRIIAQTVPGGAQYTFAYSGVSYLADNGSDTGGTTTVVFYPNGTGSGQPSTTDVYSYVDGVQQSEAVDTTGINQTKSYSRDLTTLLPTSITDLNGNTTTATDSGANNGASLPSANVLTSTDGDGNTTAYAYTSLNLPWCTVDPSDYANGRRCPSTEPLSPQAPGATYSYPGVALTFYDTVGHVLAKTDPLGNTTSYALTSGIPGVPDGLTYCTVEPVDYANGVSCPAYNAPHVTGTQTSTFDAAGDQLTSTDADGNVTSSTYDSSGRLATTTDPDGTLTTSTYNGANQVTKQVVSSGSYSATTLNAYDPQGRKYCTVGPFEAAKGVVCPGSPPSPSSPPANVTSYFYDSANRLIQQTSPIGGSSISAYDSAGNTYCSVTAFDYANGTRCPATPPSSPPTIGSDPYLGATINTYNNLSQLVQVTNPLGGITLFTYDNNGNKKTQTVESNSPTSAPNVVATTGYDADNQVVSTTVGTGSAASVTQTNYDPDGNAFCLVSANASAATGSATFHCPTWQTSWITSPPSPATLYSTSPTSAQANNVTVTIFNADGSEVQSTNPDVQTSISAFDADQRAYCTSDPVNVAASLAAHPSYPYLCPVSPPATPPTGTTGYTTTIFDPAGRTLSSTDQLGNTTTTAYDAAGHTLSVTDPRGKVTTSCYYGQSGAGQCAASAPSGGGSNDDLYSTTTPATAADPSGEKTSYTYFAGDTPHTTTTLSGTTTDSYDASLDLTGATYSGTASGYSTPANQSYTYFSDGSRHTMTDGSGTTTYSEDANGDVTQQQFVAGTGTSLANKTVAYGYYSTGVQASVSYPTYGTHTNPQATYAYDALGNMVSETDWLSNKITFTHDGDGNLTSQNNAVTGSAPNGTSNTTFSYDAADQNAQATSTLTCGGSTGTLTQSFSGSAGSRNADGQVTQDSESYASPCTGASYQRDYSYDAAGRVVYQGSAAQGSTANNIAYDASGDPTEISSHDSSGTFDSYSQSFDNAGEVTGQTPVAGSSGSTSTYSYDTLGDRSTTTTGSTSTNYKYNQLGQMTSSTPNTPAALYTGDGLEAATYGAPTWGAVTNIDSTRALESVSCTSATFCAVVDHTGHAFTYNGTSWSTPNQVDASRSLNSVSCTSSSFCVAVDGQGYGLIYNGSSWSATPFVIDSGKTLHSVSCASSTFCVASASSGGVAFYNGSTWTVNVIDGSRGLDAVSCPTTTFCVALDGAGRAFTTSNGTTWSSANDIDGTNTLDSVSCTSATFCVAVDAVGNALTYTGLPTWSLTDIDGSNVLNSVSCSSSAFCQAVDGSGNAVALIGTGWSSPTSIDTTNALEGVICLSSSLCAAVDNVGNAVFYRPGSAVNAQLIWDTNSSLALTLSDGTNDYVYGPTGEPVEQVNVTSTPPVNNPTFMTYTPSDSSWLITNSSGAQTSFYRYDAFGNLAYGTPGSTFGYAGQYQDTGAGSSGFDNMRARWYDGQTGEFTSRDPAFDQSDKAYEYSNGDSVNRSDPSGRDPVGEFNNTTASFSGISSPCTNTAGADATLLDKFDASRIEYEPEVTTNNLDGIDTRPYDGGPLSDCLGKNGSTYVSGPPGSLCFWVAEGATEIWNSRPSGSDKIALFVGIEYVCAKVWGFSSLSECSQQLIGTDISSPQSAADSVILGSGRDNSINWLFSRYLVSPGQSGVPGGLACAVGELGPTVLNPISFVGGILKSGASSAVATALRATGKTGVVCAG